MLGEITKIDTQGNTTYVGKSNGGAETTNPVWSIMKIESVGNETNITYPDGKADTSYVWDDRTTYDYK